MLPLLYNALQAQPRLHTFVFAALNGEAGEKAFFDPLRKKAGPSPAALVVLNKIGLGAPSIYTVKPALFSKKSHAIAETVKLLESDGDYNRRHAAAPKSRPLTACPNWRGKSHLQSR